MLTVDVVIKTPEGVVLVKRGNEPYEGKWALPGGFVRYGERVEEAAVREALEETGLEVKLQRLVGIYSDPERDPRGHVVSACFLAKRIGGKLKAASDAKGVKIFKRIPWRELAFDHAQILKDVMAR
jgi:8-oxo-dGTP diphosphatase